MSLINMSMDTRQSIDSSKHHTVLGMGRGKPRVTRGVSALGTQPSKFGWVGYPTQKICGSPGRPMGFSPPHPLGLAAAERA
jgi:hypothetical protein